MGFIRINGGRPDEDEDRSDYPAAFTAPVMLGGCAVLAGAAAVDYFVDDNDVCEGRNDVGLLDSDCHDDTPG